MFQIAIYVFLAAASSEIFSDNKEVFRREEKRGQRGESEAQQIIREAYHGDSREYLSTFLQQNKQMFSILKYFNLKEFKKGFYLLGL